jgi:hypothetical protein
MEKFILWHLRAQHKLVLDAVRAGQMDMVLRKPDTPKGLRARWLSAEPMDAQPGL